MKRKPQHGGNRGKILGNLFDFFEQPTAIYVLMKSDDPHYFDFDLDRGIRLQVVEKLESSPIFPLAKGIAPTESGIYALYYRDKMAYIGKASKGTTKSKRTLRLRLDEHVIKISGRQNISLDEMKCRYLTFASE
jgi:hypothetical protein